MAMKMYFCACIISCCLLINPASLKSASPSPPGPAPGTQWNYPTLYPAYINPNQSMVDGGPQWNERAIDREYSAPNQINDAMHNEFMRNSGYALADGLLNATWKELKANLSPHRYYEMREDQRLWIAEGRERVANSLMSRMGIVEAFTEATMRRVNELARLIAREPAPGKYSCRHADFTVSGFGADITVRGSAWSERGSSCEFTGYEVYSGSPWRRMRHDENEFNDFYILFTDYGAGIYYPGSEVRQGCGVGARFNYTYERAGY